MQILRDLLDTIIGFFFDVRADVTVRENHCAACANMFTENAKYCSNCGEPRPVIPRDISVYALLKEYLTQISTFNAKMITTWIWLVFRPGLLSKAHFLGIKNRVHSAYAVLVTVIAFFTLTNTSTIFYSSAEEMAWGYEQKGFNLSNVLKFDIKQGIIDRSKMLNKERSNFEAKIEKYANVNANTYYLTIWPIWGIIISMIMFRTARPLGCHFIFAANMFSTYLIWRTVIYYISFNILGFQSLSNISSVYLNLSFVAYTTYSLAVAYQIQLRDAILKGLLLAFAFIGLIIIYRQAWTVIAFYNVT